MIFKRTPLGKYHYLNDRGFVYHHDSDPENEFDRVDFNWFDKEPNIDLFCYKPADTTGSHNATDASEQVFLACQFDVLNFWKDNPTVTGNT